MDSKTLQEAALNLPPDERAALAEKLLSSLDEPSEAELERAWLVGGKPPRPPTRQRGCARGFRRGCAAEGAVAPAVTIWFHPEAEAEAGLLDCPILIRRVRHQRR